MAPPLAVAWIIYGFVTLLVGAAFGYGAGHAMKDPKLVPAWWRDWMTTLAAMVAAILWPVWLVVGLVAAAIMADIEKRVAELRAKCAVVPDAIAACGAPISKYPMPASCAFETHARYTHIVAATLAWIAFVDPHDTTCRCCATTMGQSTVLWPCIIYNRHDRCVRA